MTNKITSNAERAERIAEKLGASELFGATLGSANGNVALGAPQQPAGAPETGVQQPQDAPQRHVVPGVGAAPSTPPEHAGQTPYQHLADLIGAH